MLEIKGKIMKVKIFNKSESSQYIDIKGDELPEDVVILGPKNHTTVDVASEAQYLKLASAHRKTLVLRKLS